MRVILFQDIPPLGKKYDVKEVRDGFARNFLLPRNLAAPATQAALKTLAAQRAREEREKSEEYQKYNAVVERLKSRVLSFRVRIGEKGRAFGSVTAAKIRDALKKEGIQVEKDWIQLEESIKTTGEQRVPIKFPRQILGEVRVVVESDNLNKRESG